MTTLAPEAIRPSRTSIVTYAVVTVLLYIGDLVIGTWSLLHGLLLTDQSVGLVWISISILNWIGAWVICYVGYRRSKILGYVLVALTVALTVLIIAGVFVLALFAGLTSGF